MSDRTRHLETCAVCRAQQQMLHQMLTTLHSPLLDHASADAIHRAQNLFRDNMASYTLPDSLLETA